MGNLVFKPATGGGNKVIFQNQGGSDALTVEDSGNITLAGTANNLGTVTAGTLDDAVTYRNINQDLGSADTASFANLVAHESTQLFTATGTSTWTKPAGIKKIFVELVGAGGGGSGSGESAGAGGYAAKWINVTAIASETVTIGTGGSGVTYSGTGGNGGSTSFGGHLSATGGQGGAQGQHRGGAGGSGSGGAVNFQGGGGMGHNTSNSGHIGGASYFGGGSPGCHSTNSHASQYDRQGGPGGGGATGNHGTVHRGAHGANGYVVVWEYQ
ncbi:uncharacterized protein METZ01_LOCUS310212 [marine metagenome]|uniref:Glycine-rich domain-containing protein n=1 Tax=marine metagenome TaxID=408172 RepID=A0A382NA03_9ZZZZ